jgi:hypothetical protein
VGSKSFLIPPEDADLQVLVLACYAADKEVDRPAAADVPGVRVTVEVASRRSDVGK